MIPLHLMTQSGVQQTSRDDAALVENDPEPTFCGCTRNKAIAPSFPGGVRAPLTNIPPSNILIEFGFEKSVRGRNTRIIVARDTFVREIVPFRHCLMAMSYKFNVLAPPNIPSSDGIRALDAADGRQERAYLFVEERGNV